MPYPCYSQGLANLAAANSDMAHGEAPGGFSSVIVAYAVVAAQLLRDLAQQDNSIALLKQAARLVDPSVGTSVPDQAGYARIASDLADMCCAHGMLQEAADYASSAVKQQSLLDGPGKTSDLGALALGRHGAVLYKLGHLHEAAAALDSSLTAYQALDARGHKCHAALEQARTLDLQGLVHAAQGKWQQSETVFFHSLRLKLTAVGSLNPHVGVSLSNLGQMYRQAGKQDAARRVQEHALLIATRSYGPYDKRTAACLSNLAATMLETTHQQPAASTAIAAQPEVPSQNLSSQAGLLVECAPDNLVLTGQNGSEPTDDAATLVLLESKTTEFGEYMLGRHTYPAEEVQERLQLIYQLMCKCGVDTHTIQHELRVLESQLNAQIVQQTTATDDQLKVARLCCCFLLFQPAAFLRCCLPCAAASPLPPSYLTYCSD